MTATKIQDFFAPYPVRVYNKGETIIQAGNKPAVHYISDGTVVQYDISENGDKLIVNTYKPGAFISLACILNDISSTFFFGASNQVTVHQAPKSDVVTWLRDNPDIVYDALARISRGGDGLMLRLARTMEGNAENRIINELTILSARFPSPDGWITISNTSLATQTGLARETVSRTLKHLSARGLVATRQGQITLL